MGGAPPAGKTAQSTVLQTQHPQHITAHHSTTQHITAHHSTSQHHSTTQHITAQHSTSQHHSTTQHHTAHHSTSQHHTAHHSTTQHITAPHSNTQHHTAHHSTTAPHSTTQCTCHVEHHTTLQQVIQYNKSQCERTHMATPHHHTRCTLTFFEVVLVEHLSKPLQGQPAHDHEGGRQPQGVLPLGRGLTWSLNRSTKSCSCCWSPDSAHTSTKMGKFWNLSARPIASLNWLP